MRILVVSQYFWPESFRINDVAQGLKERGHQVEVLTGKPNYPGGSFFRGYGFFGRWHEDCMGIQVMRVPLAPRRNGNSFRLVLNYLSFALFAIALAPWRCRGKFDAIFVYQPSPFTVVLPALLLKRLRRAPLMLWVQDLWPESLSATGVVRNRRLLSVVEALVRFTYRRCDRILVQSRAFIASVQALGADPTRIRYFPNSAEPLYRPLEPVRDLPDAVPIPRGFRIMFAGNIGVAQDFETILGAALRLRGYPDIHWLVLGDGRMHDWVREQAKTHALQQTFHLLGRHPVEMMPRFFSISDAMLVTLRNEPIFALTIPAKLQSYLACAKPIIAALDGEAARVIGEAGAGIAVRPQDPDALADAVLAIYRMSPDRRREMGERGRRYFDQHFEREMLLDRLEGWMREMTVQA